MCLLQVSLNQERRWVILEPFVLLSKSNLIAISLPIGQRNSWRFASRLTFLGSMALISRM
jgi:hypothetical protein